MKQLFAWVFSHKLVTLLTIVILFLIFRRSQPIPYQTFPQESSTLMMPFDKAAGTEMRSNQPFIEPPGDSYAPSPDVANRMVVQTSHLSLLVKNVSESMQNIKSFVEQNGGYMVETNLSNPDEAANGTITLRIPQTSLDQALAHIRSLGVRVVSENIQGTDVTDEFEDVGEKLRILEQNKARLEELMDRAVEISDISNIQQQIFNVQNQIDSLKGRQNYLEKTSQMALISVYVSTDELALPYSPANPWRAQLVFKYAVRSLLTNLQQFGSFLIWAGVYSVVIIPLVIGLLLLYRFFNRLPR